MQNTCSSRYSTDRHRTEEYKWSRWHWYRLVDCIFDKRNNNTCSWREYDRRSIDRMRMTQFISGSVTRQLLGGVAGRSRSSHRRTDRCMFLWSTGSRLSAPREACPLWYTTHPLIGSTTPRIPHGLLACLQNITFLFNWPDDELYCLIAMIYM